MWQAVRVRTQHCRVLSQSTGTTDHFREREMGSYTSKTKLSVEDMAFLQAKTQLDQASIQVDRPA